MIKGQNQKYPAEAWDILQSLFKEQKINDHTLHFVASFSGEIDFGLLQKAIAICADVFPLIRCLFNNTGKRPYWEENHFSENDMALFSETEDTDQKLEEFLGFALDETSGPQVKAGLFRQNGKDTLAILMNHMLCDGAGFKEFLYLLGGIYTELENNTVKFHPISGSRRIAQLLRSFSFVDRIKIFTSKNDMSTHDPAKFELEGDLSNPFIEKRVISSDSFTQMAAYAKERQATINDLLLTAFIRILYRQFGRPVAVPSSIDLRKYLPENQAEGFCNLCTNLTCNIGKDLGISFGQTLNRVKQTMFQEKSNTACLKSLILLEMCFDIFPYKTAKSFLIKSFSNASIAFTNIGILDSNRLQFGNLEITEAFMTGSIKYSPYFQMAISTFRNQATLSVNLYGTIHDRKLISDFLDNVMLELQTRE